MCRCFENRLDIWGDNDQYRPSDLGVFSMHGKEVLMLYEIMFELASSIVYHEVGQEIIYAGTVAVFQRILFGGERCTGLSRPVESKYE